MRKILVLTDFSDTCVPATAAAVYLSASLNANLILFNTFISQPALSENGGNPWSVEELMWADKSKEKLAFIKEDMELLIAALPADKHHASIDCRRGLGTLGPQVQELLGKEAVELVVMGARTSSSWEHILMGSDTLSVINHADRPVVIIPAAHPLKQLKKITVATDFDEGDLKAIHYLTRIGRLIGFQLEIVHVKLRGENDNSAAQHVAFEKHVAKFNYPGITYRNIAGKDLVNRINGLCENNGTDLLVLVHDKHSLLDRLFKKTNARALLEQQRFPLMVIPAKIKMD